VAALMPHVHSLVHRRRALLGGLALAGCVEIPPPGDIALARPAFPLPRDFPTAMVTRNNGLFTIGGRQQFLRGVAVPEVAWIANRHDEQMGFFDHRMFNAAADWGCDLLRLSIMPALWTQLGEAEVLRTLDASVAYAKRCGMYLSICWHGIGFPPTERYKSLIDVRYGELLQTSTAQTHAFWRSMARRYWNEPVVAFFELFNEPQYINADGSLATEHTEPMWVAWRDWCETCIDDLRRIAPLKPVAVGGLQFGYDLSFAPDLPVRRPNVIYATHPYPDSNWRVPWSRAFLEPGQRLPVMATEFGWDDANHPQAAMRGETGRYQEAILAAFDQAAMGWQAWCFNHTFTPSLLADTQFAPSPGFGDFVMQALQLRKRATTG